MRPEERITPFLQKVDLKHLFEEIWNLYLPNIYLAEVESFWLENPDLRFSQVLINMEIIPNYTGFWYYMEEPEILIKQGHKPSDVYYWGINYDKDMNKLPEIIRKPISELDTEHIKAILNGDWVKKESKYYQIFKDELKSRENDK